MLSIIYLFIILASFIIYKIMCEYQNFNKEKSVWSRLIYWGIVIFISAIFNVTLYINNTNNYKISFYLDKDNLHLIVFVIIIYFIIQILSPTLFKGRISGVFKSVTKEIKGAKGTQNSRKENSVNNYMNLESDRMKDNIDLNESILRSYKGLEKKNGNYYEVKGDVIKNLHENHFELFLNTFCLLSFFYVIFIQTLFSVISILQNYKVDLVLKENFIERYVNLKGNLNDIACFLMLLIIPVSLRQIVYYLFKLKENNFDNCSKGQDFLKNNPQYELIQKRLAKNNKRL